MKTLIMLFLLSIPSISQASQHSIFLGSYTLHGIKGDQITADSMPYRIDDGGRLVFTPGLGYRYTNDHDWSLMGSFVKDCYFHNAGTLMVGKTFLKSQYLNLDAQAGFYLRENPMYKDEDGTMSLATDYPFPLQMDGWQAIPMAFIGIELMPSWKVKPYVSTNYFITNFSLKLDF